MPQPDPAASDAELDCAPTAAGGVSRFFRLPEAGRRLRSVPLLAGVALALLFTRRPDQFMRPQFWAEDGSVFFRQAALDGWPSFWWPYHGYLHAFPRLVALVFRPLPWEWMPAAFALAAAAATLYVVVRIARSRLPPAVAAFGAAAILLVPHNGEVWLNLCCFHCMGAALLAVNLLEPAPAPRAERWRRTAEVVAIGLSGPEIILAVPFLVLRTWQWRRERSAAPIVIGGLAAAGIQALVLLASPLRSTLAAPGLALDGLAPAALRSLRAFAPGELPGGALIGATVVFAVILVLVALDNPAPNRWRTAFLAGGGMLVLLAARRAWPDWHSVLVGTRFVYLAAVLLALALGWLFAGARRPLARAGVGLLALSILSLSIRHWQSFVPADFRWAEQVRAARRGERSQFLVPPAVSFPVPRPPRGGMADPR